MHYFIWVFISVFIIIASTASTQDNDNENASDFLPSFDMSTFSSIVSSPRMYLLETFSSRCGSCTEFTPIFQEIVKELITTGIYIEMGTINIDEDKGMTLANNLGILEEGIPNLRFFMKDGDKVGTSLMKGQVESKEIIMKRILQAVQGASRDDMGYLLKTTSINEEL